jgi:eukaryotic-like serine/threonine-protein kinase
MKISFDDLEIGPLLGVGTVGAVYRASLRGMERPIAVKLLKSPISQDRLVRARFRREMAILERMNHPNIIRYYGGGSRDDQLFFCMELITTGTAKELLERFGQLAWTEVASIARQVASALQHAHNNGIIHRDLKPGNLFVTDQGQIKLGDFGIARDTHATDLTGEGLTVGTHAYMAPEQITGDAAITGKADLYSLGCVLFEMLTGRKPFEGTNFAVLFEQHLRKPAPSVREFHSGCPESLVQLIAQLLEKDPDKRPFNARAVQGAAISILASTKQAAVSLPRQPALSLTAAGQQSVRFEATAHDVGAGAVKDVGMESLSRKLAVSGRNETSWRVLVVLAVVALIIVALASFFSSF